MNEGLKKSFFRALGIVFVLSILISPSVFFYMKYRETNNLLQNPTEASKKEVKEVVAKLSMLIQLPKDEEPTIATVLDKEKLKDQPFFVNAEKGDKVVIFSKAQKAILYRPNTNRIIEVAPINLGASSLPIPVVLYNGTTTTGLTTTLEKELKDAVTGVSVVSKENAKRTDYAKTIVVDLAGTHATEAKQLADYLGGDVGLLPAGEVKPDAATKAEILIIVGKNYAASNAATPKATPTPTASNAATPSATPQP